MLNNLDNLISSIKGRKVYVYGAKGQPWHVYNYLRLKGVPVAGFVVTSTEGNPSNVDGLPVVSVDRYVWDDTSLLLISFPFRSNPFNSIFQLLIDKGIKNAVFIPDSMYKEMQNSIVDIAFNQGSLSVEKGHPVEQEHGVLSFTDVDNKYYWRFAYREFISKRLEDIRGLFAYRPPLDEFEDTYGRYNELKRLKGDNKKNDVNKAIYMARSHADRDTNLADKGLKDWIVPIQVGAALTDKSIYEIKDNTGDNISEKNGNFSEATAIYWMWKNASKTDYIGLNHYRRQIDIDESDWNRIVGNDTDVIVTRPTFVPQGNGAFFASLVPKSDVDFFNRAVDEVAPEYSKAKEKYMTSRFYPPCNIYVMKYEHFIDYAKLVFDVVFRVEKMYENIGFVRKDRYMGYLVEALLGIWLIKHKEEIKIAYTDMIFLEK